MLRGSWARPQRREWRRPPCVRFRLSAGALKGKAGGGAALGYKVMPSCIRVSGSSVSGRLGNMGLYAFGASKGFQSV